MSIETVLLSEEGKTQYDKAAKLLLRNPQTIAWIVKYTIKEFADMSIEEIKRGIQNVYTDIPLDPGLTNTVNQVLGQNTEDYVPGEGRIVYDYLNLVIAMIFSMRVDVNVEVNNGTDSPKVLFPRSVYYSSRMISSQGNRDFSIKDHEYDKIHKVVSIWISFGVQDSYADRIISFSLKPEFRHGEPFTINGNYDLIEITHVMVGRTRSKENELTGFLFTLFSNDLTYDEKIKLLTTEYGMSLNEDERKAVNDMIGLNVYEIDRRAKEKAKELAKELAKEQAKELAKELAAKIVSEKEAEMNAEMEAKMKAEMEARVEAEKAEAAEAAKAELKQEILPGITSLIKNGVITKEQACMQFKLSEEELESYLNS